MHHLKVILILLLKKISTEIVHANVLVNAMNYEVLSISSQTVAQIEIILKVILSEVSKLNGYVMSMKQGDQRHHTFLEKKELHKVKNGFTFNKHPEISSQLIHRVRK